MNVAIHIEELALHGLPAAARYRIADAATAELERLVREQGLPSWLAAGEYVVNVDGGVIPLTPDAPPEQLGVQIARAIYGGQRQ